MRYKVYDTVRKRFVTDNPYIILKPDGRLAINEYGDEIGIPQCIALFYPAESDNYYIDEVGGIHDSGCGWSPDGSNCGECSNISCKICEVWSKKSKRAVFTTIPNKDGTVDYFIQQDLLDDILRPFTMDDDAVQE